MAISFTVTAMGEYVCYGNLLLRKLYCCRARLTRLFTKCHRGSGSRSNESNRTQIGGNASSYRDIFWHLQEEGN